MTPVPDAPQPAKRKSAAAKAREAEAADGFAIIEQCGVKLRVPVGNVPIAAIDASLAGDEYTATKLMLGEEQWKALSDAGAGSRDISELSKKVSEAVTGQADSGN